LVPFDPSQPKSFWRRKDPVPRPALQSECAIFLKRFFRSPPAIGFPFSFYLPFLTVLSMIDLFHVPPPEKTFASFYPQLSFANRTPVRKDSPFNFFAPQVSAFSPFFLLFRLPAPKGRRMHIIFSQLPSSSTRFFRSFFFALDSRLHFERLVFSMLFVRDSPSSHHSADFIGLVFG